MDTILPLTLTVFAMTITPGPNCLMVSASGANFGFRRTVPHILGVGVGVPVMVGAAGLGMDAVFAALPSLREGIRWAGMFLLFYLAWRIARFRPVREDDRKPAARPITFMEAVLFQWVNPKAWLMVFAALSSYVTGRHGVWTETAWVAAAFFYVNVPNLSLWTLLGASLSGHLREHPVHARLFNGFLGLMLAGTALSLHWM